VATYLYRKQISNVSAGDRQPLNIISIPVLEDNYIHVLRDDISETTVVVDPALAEPVIAELNRRKWNLTHLLLTHHHGDHIGGVEGLTSAFPQCETYGFTDDQSRLPPLTYSVSDGDELMIARTKFEVWHLPGHTTGHIGFISRDAKLAFTGDVLFGMGCGRLFEGTPAQMYRSLARFKSLSPDTKVYCTHEYTVTNGYFAKAVMPSNQKISIRLDTAKQTRSDGSPTVPLTLGEELGTNPFLLAQNLEEFTRYREQRNAFKVVR
jgi:hydroxyacylglutathione hydrolase